MLNSFILLITKYCSVACNHTKTLSIRTRFPVLNKGTGDIFYASAHPGHFFYIILMYWMCLQQRVYNRPQTTETLSDV